MGYFPVDRSTRNKDLSDEIYAIVFKAIRHRPADSAGIVQGNMVYGDGAPQAGNRRFEFTVLADTPSAYTGEASKLVRVNAGETGLEFVTVGTAVTPSTAYFGDGSDGAATVAVDANFGGDDKYYTDLTINAGKTLTMDYGVRIYCSGTLTVNGTIRTYGAVGGNGGNGSGVTGGSVGAAPIFQNYSTIYGAVSAGPGGGGGNGGNPGMNGSNGNAGGGGDTSANSIGIAGVNGKTAGKGGNGGGGRTGGNGGGGGTGGAVTAITGKEGRSYAHLSQWRTLEPDGSAFALIQYSAGNAGSGGGGGGAGGAPDGYGGGGGGGASSGANGGCIYIAAKNIVIGASGVISAAGWNGGNGGNGANGASVGIGAAGGGGAGSGGNGGHGGLIVLVYNSLTNGGTITAAGGTGGTKGTVGTGINGGQNGSAGNDGDNGTDGEIIQWTVN